MISIWDDDISLNVRQIQTALKFEDAVKMKCFSKSEVVETKAMLTEAERKRVQFSWLEFADK